MAMIIMTRRLIMRVLSRPPPRPPLAQFCTSTDSGPEFIIPKAESPLGIVSFYGNYELTKEAMSKPGMDYKHWTAHMSEPASGDGATKDQIIDCYIQTLAKVVGSEEEAKKRIYKVVCKTQRRLRFGCQVDWKTAHQLLELPQVFDINADHYYDPKNKDYGGELFVNGKIVERSRDG